MVVQMLERRIRLVVVNGAIVFMMMVNTLIVLQFMRKRCRPVRMRQGALDGETIQGHAEQKQNADNQAQNFSLVNGGIIAA